MKKYIILVLVLIFASLYAYFFPYQKNIAVKNTDLYIQKQGIKDNDIKTREIKKDWKMGGYLTTLVLKKQTDLVYEYDFDKRMTAKPYYIDLIIYDDGSGLNSDDSRIKFKSLTQE